MNRGGWLMPYRASEGAPPSSPQGYRAAEARKNAGRPRRISGDLKRGGEDMTNTDIDGAVGIRRKAHAKQVMLAGASSLLALAFASQASAEEHRAPPPAADQPAPATPAAATPQAQAESGRASWRDSMCQDG